MPQPTPSFVHDASPSRPRVIRLRELRLEQAHHVLTPFNAWLHVRATVDSLLSTGRPCRNSPCSGAEALVEDIQWRMGGRGVYYPTMSHQDPRMEACRRLLYYGDSVVLGKAIDRIVDIENDASRPEHRRWVITRYGRSADNAHALLRHVEALERQSRLRMAVPMPARTAAQAHSSTNMAKVADTSNSPRHIESHDCRQSRVCTGGWRQNDSFLRESEGALVTEGYVPVYKHDVKNSAGELIYKKGEVIRESGVTISTGVDLGQQNELDTRNVLNRYIRGQGGSSDVNPDALVEKLKPYFEKRKQAALDVLGQKPLKIDESEASLLEKAFSYNTHIGAANQFDSKNVKGMAFKKLPEEAQTVIIDFAYQYGLSDSKGGIRKTFWTHVYEGEWQELADWLKAGPDAFKTRRRREGEYLQSGIDNNNLPSSGNPCLFVNGAGT